MGNETKRPVPGEWWRSNTDSENAFICGFDVEGDPVFQTDDQCPAHIDLMDDFLSEWHHEPDCTGFDWVPKQTDDKAAIETIEDISKTWLMNSLAWRAALDRVIAIAKRAVEDDSEPSPFRKPFTNPRSGMGIRKREPAEVWPKWYVHKDTELTWCLRREESGSTSVSVGRCGEFASSAKWDLNNDSYVSSGHWLEVTEAEALARGTPQKKTRTVTFRKWIVWDELGKEKILMLRDCDRVQNWLHCHDTGETETHEVPE